MEKQAINSDSAPKALGPYSQAVRSGDLLFLSGQLGIDPVSGKMAPGGTAAQAEQVFKNIAAVLAAAGADLSRVLKTTVFLADMADFPALNEVYARHFEPPFPARSTFSVKGLPLGAAVEIEVIARL